MPAVNVNTCTAVEKQIQWMYLISATLSLPVSNKLIVLPSGRMFNGELMIPPSLRRQSQSVNNSYITKKKLPDLRKYAHRKLVQRPRAASATNFEQYVLRIPTCVCEELSFNVRLIDQDAQHVRIGYLANTE